MVNEKYTSSYFGRRQRNKAKALYNNIPKTSHAVGRDADP